MQDTHTFEKPINYLDMSLGKLILVEDCRPRLTAVWKLHRELMVSLLTIIGAFFLTVWLTIERIVSRPVKRLASASRRLADGDFNAPLLKMGRDEIGTLSKVSVTCVMQSTAIRKNFSGKMNLS